VKAADKVWTVTLAPTFRMINRGATKEMVAVGKTVSAYGYASLVEKDEMRAERITVDGKTVEMR
jgi:predicted transcriptional regulator